MPERRNDLFLARIEASRSSIVRSSASRCDATGGMWQLIASQRPGMLAAMASCAAALLVAGCQKKDAAEIKPPVAVRVLTVETTDYLPTTSLTGAIAARTLNNLAFRVGGRIAQRLVEVGQHVDTGEVLARLDPQEQESDLRSAQADLNAANASLTQASAAFERQKTLLAQGVTTRRDYDSANAAQKVAQGSVEAANSALANARENLSFTELRAGVPGIVTARSIEAGQVVQAAQTIFTVAEDGDRDAVFSVHETLAASTAPDPEVAIALVSDPAITAVGKVHEISPAVDRASGTIRVKVGIPQTLASLPLGAAVVGTVSGRSRTAIHLPWQALTSQDGKPAVWVFNPISKTVTVTTVEVIAYETGAVIVGNGLKAGQKVVIAGGQLLSPVEVVEATEVKP